jgi:hypothetical protein
MSSHNAHVQEPTHETEPASHSLDVEWRDGTWRTEFWIRVRSGGDWEVQAEGTLTGVPAGDVHAAADAARRELVRLASRGRRAIRIPIDRVDVILRSRGRITVEGPAPGRVWREGEAGARERAFIELSGGTTPDDRGAIDEKRPH